MDAWTTLEQELSSALGVLADVPVSTSAVLLPLIAYGGWRLWAWFRARAEAAARTPARHSERTSMTSRLVTDLHGLHVRWDRVALLGVGILAALVFLVTAVCALAGLATGGAAVVALVAALASVAGLRTLAVRDRTRRAAQPGSEAEPETAPVEVVEAAPEVLADPERDRRTLETVLSLEDERPAAAADVVAPAAERPAPTVAPTVHAERTVVVPPVPRPVYLDAPEVERPLPEPYVAEPAGSSSMRLKDAVDEERREHIRATAERDLAALDLDGVLARRRAG